jgi:hypothetical protein
VFPQASVKVHVLVVTKEVGQLPCTVVSSPITVIVSPQLSVAVNEIIGGTSPIHANVISAGAVGGVGGVVSFTVIVCVTIDVFEHASVNVHVLVIVNELAQFPGTTVSTPCTVIDPPQLSVAVNEVIGGTSVAQDKVISAGAFGTTGATLSLTEIV